MTKELPTLAPCPYCGASGDSLVTYHEPGTVLHPWHRIECDHCGAKGPGTDRGTHQEAWNRRTQSATVVAPGVTKVDPGFRWDHEAKHHVPTLLVEFTPCPLNSGSESRGWKDRDALAAAISTQPVQAQGEAAFLHRPGAVEAFRADVVARWPAGNRREMTEKLYTHPAPAVARGLSEAQEREAFKAWQKQADIGSEWEAWKARAALAASAPSQAEPARVHARAAELAAAPDDARHLLSVLDRTDWTIEGHRADSEWQDAASCERVSRICKALLTAPSQAEPSYQQRVEPWLLACFGAEIAGDKIERNHRHLEEALELVQACGCTRSEAHQLVDYVFDRPAGDPFQEAGGVLMTLAALCRAQGIDMHAAGEAELTRVWGKVEQIRAKQAAKPKHSPLPQAAPTQAGSCQASDGLANCPHCGAPAELTDPPTTDEPWVQVACKGCGARGPETMRDVQGAIAGWNRRAPPAGRTLTDKCPHVGQCHPGHCPCAASSTAAGERDHG